MFLDCCKNFNYDIFYNRFFNVFKDRFLYRFYFYVYKGNPISDWCNPDTESTKDYVNREDYFLLRYMNLLNILLDVLYHLLNRSFLGRIYFIDCTINWEPRLLCVLNSFCLLGIFFSNLLFFFLRTFDNYHQINLNSGCIYFTSFCYFSIIYLFFGSSKYCECQRVNWIVFFRSLFCRYYNCTFQRFFFTYWFSLLGLFDLYWGYNRPDWFCCS